MCNCNKDNVKDDPSLTEPLLPLVEVVTTDNNNNNNMTNNSDWSMVYAKLISSLAGCGMAILSHSFLSLVLWKDNILRANTMDIVMFSIAWSFWTCVILFAGMIAFVSSSMSTSTTSSNNNIKNLANNNDDNNDDNNDEETDVEDEYAFQIEAQYVVSSLLTITAIWMLDSIVWSSLLVVIMMGLILIGTIQDQTILASYSLIAGTLGLIFGACSQFLLSLWMWRDVAMTQPIIDHIVWFSLACSTLTVLMTFCGCLSLRWIVAGGSNNKSSRNTSQPMQRRRRRSRRQAILRMEAVYVAMTLVGICAAWIFLDVTAGLPEQIIPSLLMLFISLAAFTLILQCFPEEDCLEAEVEAVVESISNIVLVTPTKKTTTTTTATKASDDNDKEGGSVLLIV